MKTQQNVSCSDVMNKLKELGTDQNKKIYLRHGSPENVFGVSYENLKKIKKQIGENLELALKLWNTQNTDARTLALLIAPPDKIHERQCEAWVKELNYPLLSGELAALVAQTTFYVKKIEKWTHSKKEYTRSCGYSTLSSSLKRGREISDEMCKKYLIKVEKEIHTSPNRARYAMNNTVIAIGVFKPHLSTLAIKTAKRIGEVTVDHGQTNCKTPDAVTYIKKSLKRKK